MDVLSQFEQLGPLLAQVVDGISVDQLDNPTPCASFTVREVLEHMIAGATAFVVALGADEAPDPCASDVRGAFVEALTALASAVTAPGALDRVVVAPFGRVPGTAFAQFVVLDGVVHGWDLATATGQGYWPPAALVDDVAAFARRTIDALRAQGMFGPAVEAAPSATPIERLVAFTGRDPSYGSSASTRLPG